MSADDLRELSRGLASETRAERDAAIEAMSSLPPSALPAIRERLALLRRARPSSEEPQALLHSVRHATGSRRADDMIDVADGVPIILAERRDRDILLIAEPLLLLRSLERQSSTEALSLVPEVLRLDRNAWTMEGRRLIVRLGDRAAAAAILARSHEDRAGREWARWTSTELGLDNPGRLVQRLEPHDLADVLSAWGATRTMDALGVLSSYLDDSRRAIRQAARAALAAYERNSLWTARDVYRLRLGERAPEEWGWERTLQELFSGLDRRRLEAVSDLEDAARASIAEGDFASASASLERLLSRAPDAASDEIALLFGEIGRDHLESDRRPASRLAYERALRMAPGHERADAWQARLAFLEAEDALALGLLDLDGYRRAATTDPSCARCVRVLAELEPQTVVRAPEAPTSRAPFLWFGALLFALLGAALVMSPTRRPAVSDEVDEPVEERAAADSSELLSAFDGARPLDDSTLPGE